MKNPNSRLLILLLSFIFCFNIQAQTFDVGVTDAIVSSGCYLSSQEAVEVTVENFGSEDILTGELLLNIALNGTLQATELYANSLSSGTTGTYTFLTTLNLSGPGNHTVNVYPTLVGTGSSDINSSNDTVAVTLFSQASLTTGYNEGDFLNEDYYVLNTNLYSKAYIDPISGNPLASITLTGDDANTTYTYASNPYDPFTENPNHTSSAELCIDLTNGDLSRLYFDLKQTTSYTITSADGSFALSNFRVLVNGVQDGPIYHPFYFGGNDPYQTIVVDLSSYAGQTVNITLEHNGKYSPIAITASGLGDVSYIDNIQLVEIGDSDAGVAGINLSENNCNLGTNENLEVVIENFGLDTILPNTMLVTYSVNGAPGPYELFTDSLFPQSQSNFIFNNVDLSFAGMLNVKSSTLLTGDAQLINDESSISSLNGDVLVVVEILTDNTAWETGWSIENTTTGEVYASISSGTYLGLNNLLITESLCVPDASSLKFTINDVNANGISGGWYKVYACGSLVGTDGDNFGASDTTLFVAQCVPFDVGVTEIYQPVYCQLGLEENIMVEVTSFGTDDIFDFDITYSINGGTAVIETIYDTLSQGETMIYHFTTTANLSSTGSYYIESYTILPGDGNLLNDGSSTFYVNSLVTAQLNIHTVNSASQISWHIDDGTDTLYSNTNHSYLNNTTYSYNICLEPGIAYNFHAADENGNGWEGGTYSIEELPCNALIANNNGNVPLGWGMTETFTVTTNCILYDSGVIQVTTPIPGQCALTSAESITVTYENFGIFPITELDIAYSINGGPVVQEIVTTSLPPLSSSSYTFLTTADMSSLGIYDITIWTVYPNDQVPTNDTLNISVSNTPSILVPYIEDLELSNLIELQQVVTDDFDWTLHSGITSSLGTGPSGDHTTGSGNYYYLEASGNTPNKNAVLQSQCIDVVSPNLTFWYHMYGADMGNLSVEVFDGTIWVVVWSLSGDQGDDWHEASLNLANYSFNGEFKYRFIGETETGFTSDMAIDDIEVDEIGSTDIAITEVLAPLSGCNLSSAEEIEVVVQNAGAVDQTGFTIDYVLDGIQIGTYTYTDVLSAFTTDTVIIGNIDASVVGYYDLYLESNLAGDTDSLNDVLNATLVHGDQEVVVSLFTDFYGNDISWELVDVTNNLVLAEISTGDLSGSSAYNYTICAIQGTPLEFTINDLQGNGFGIAASAYYSVSVCGIDVAYGSGDFGLSEMTSFIAECPSDFDITPTHIYSMYGDCILDNEEVIVDIKNIGAFPVDSFGVSYQVNGGSVVNETVTGIVLQPLETLTYTFGANANLTGLGVVNIDTWTSLPSDINNINDTLNLMFDLSDLVEVDVNITTDFSPGEITWELVDPVTSDVLLSGGPYSLTNTLFTQSICVANFSTLEFNIYDSFGNGIAGPGGFEVSVCGVVLASGFNYGLGTTESFIATCVQQPPQISSLTEVEAACSPTSHQVCADISMLDGNLSQVILFVDEDNDGIFTPTAMNPSSPGTYCKNIAAGTFAVPISYYVVAVGDNGLDSTSQTFTYTDGGLYIDAGPDQSIITGATTPLNATTNATLTSISGSLLTQWLTNNGQKGNIFDIYASDALDITGFDVNVDDLTSITVEVYYKQGSYVGYELDAGAWTSAGSYVVQGMGMDNPTSIVLNTPISLQSGQTYAISIGTIDGAWNYFNGTTVGSLLATDGTLTIYEGLGMSNTTFSGSIFSPRCFTGIINYGSSATVTWSDPFGVIGNTSYITVAPTQTTTYTVEVNDGVCVETDQVTVVVWQDTDLQTSFGPAAACVGQEIIVPIQATSFDSVGAISLLFNYDPNVLTYTGFDVLNSPNATDPLLNLFPNAYSLGWQVNSPTPGTIILSWYNIATIGGEIYMNNDSIPETIVNVMFTGSSPATTDLTWSPGQGDCEYSNGGGDVLLAAFVNGTVVVSDGPMVDVGPDIVVCEGDPVSATATSTGVGPFTYSWSNGDTTATIIYTPVVSELLTVTVTDGAGCSAVDDLDITVIPGLIANVGPDLSVNYGTTVTITATPAGMSYLWNTGDITENITFDALASATYTVTVTDGNGCSSIDDMVLTVLSGQSIYGNITYVASGTAVPSTGSNGDVFVDVVDGAGNVIGGTIADINGAYQIDNIPDGDYSLSVQTTRIPPPSSCNSTDAQAIQLAFIGTLPLTSEMHNISGDVNESGVVNSSDGLQVRQKFVMLLQDFTSTIDGDTLRWAFSTDTLGGATPITLSGSDVQYNFTGIVYGDVNASYIPFAKYAEPKVEMINKGTMPLESYQDFELPVVVDHVVQTGAVSLVFDYPNEYLEINGISMKNKELNNDLVYNITDNEIRVSWMNSNSVFLDKNDIVINVYGRTKNLEGLSTIAIELNDQLSEFADVSAQAFSGITLAAPELKVSNNEILHLENYPNPFSEKAYIEYFLSEAGLVSLSVCNLNGEVVATLLDKKQKAGAHIIEFERNNLPSGIYVYKIIFVSESNETYHLAKRMIINN